MRTPTIVVSGGLGAGKTTWVRRLVAAHEAHRFGVVVNEFGEVGIDGDLLRPFVPEVVEIRNGCLCCVTQDQLVPAVRELLGRYAVDVLLLEMSGEADPIPVLGQLRVLGPIVDVRAHVVIADAMAEVEQATRSAPFLDALSVADHIFLSKVDRAPTASVRAWRRFLTSFNPRAGLKETSPEPVALDALLLTPPANDAGSAVQSKPHPHAHRLQSCCVVLDAIAEPDLRRLVARLGPRAKRIKGLMRVGTSWMEVQSVRGDLTLELYVGSAPARGRLVFLSDELTAPEMRGEIEALLSSADVQDKQSVVG